MDVSLDIDTFNRRARHLQQLWISQDDASSTLPGCIVVCHGKSDDEHPYQKSSVLHTWLLGYEFPSMLMLISRDKMVFLTSANKAKHLLPLQQSGKISVSVLQRTKDADQSQKLFQEFIDTIVAISNGKERMGVFAKDKLAGAFVDEWNAALAESAAKDYEKVDVSPDVANVMAPKDEDELRSIRTASKASLAIMSGYFVDEMSTIIDEERRVPHNKLAAAIEQTIDDEKFVTKLKLGGADFDPLQLDWCYTPIIQSGGKYDLKPSAFADESPLYGGVIFCSLGLRYKSYCSNIGRTYLIDPTPQHEKHYSFLVGLQKRVLELIRDGAIARDIYTKAQSMVHSKMPELEGHFLRNVGAGIGIEFRDASLVLNAKNTRVLKDGMTLSVAVGFQDIPFSGPSDTKAKNYSLCLIDTVRVTNGEPVVMTDNAKEHAAVSFFFKEDESDGAEATPKKKSAASTAAVETRGNAKSSAKGKTRGERSATTDYGAEQRRKEHQAQLAAKKQEEGMARYRDSDAIGDGEVKQKVKRFESYKRDTLLPTSVSDLKIVVDQRSHSVIVPVFGRPVPYHITTIRNVSKNDEGRFTYLRLNFVAPGQGVGKKEDLPFDDPDATFLRSLTFRSSDTDRMADIFRSIQDMKKDATKKDQEAKEFADVVEQDHLSEIKSKRPQRLMEVLVRPAIEGVKRVPGELEIHENGLRYQSPLRSDHRIDLLFNNIKHMFFQPCDHELIVIIHIHLINPIMIGKRKAKDVQIYREATDIQFDETGNRKRKYRYGDEDELEAEQEERRRRSALNKEFRAFSERIVEASQDRLDVDIPFRELGFTGVPFRANVFCQPTTDCLVQLVDPPFLVVTLTDIEVAHLERIQFGLKNFDLVFVFKDFLRPVIHINSIPMEQLDNVKEWLDSVDIAFTEGPLNLNWPTIMKTVQSDPREFFKEGGWSFLSTESDEEGLDDESDASEFEVSEAELEMSESEGSDGSDFGEASASDDDSEAEVSDESGEDWDELESKAKKQDSRKEEKRRH